MIRIAFCDDNTLQLDIIRDIFEGYDRKSYDITADFFTSGSSLYEKVKSSGAYDIYILDMIMPDMTGIELASALRINDSNGIIIFLTSSVEHAVSSYDVNAFYYMLKPVDREKLYRVLDRAVALVGNKSQDFIVNSTNGDVSIATSSIVWIEHVNRRCTFYLSSGKFVESKTIRSSFREYVSMLTSYRNFAFCGASAMVNLSFVQAVDSSCVMFSDGSSMIPPQSAYKDFKLAWREFRIGGVKTS